MKSTIHKRSLEIAGHKTSVSLEDEFWSALKEIARNEGVTVFDLTTRIDSGKGAKIEPFVRHPPFRARLLHSEATADGRRRFSGLAKGVA